MTYTELKIKRGALFSRVVEVTHEVVKPHRVLKVKTLFTGNLVSCEAFIRLKKLNVFI